MFEPTPAWRSTYPEAHAGALVMRAVSNPIHHPELESQKAVLEQELRKQFSGQERAAIASHPTLRAYAEYYRQFKNWLSHPAAARVHCAERQVDSECGRVGGSHVHGRDEGYAADCRA